MRRIKVRHYLDVVLSHPEYTAEELEAIIEKEEKECEKLTEWQEIY